MANLIEEELPGPLVRSGIWRLETVHLSSVIPILEGLGLNTQNNIQSLEEEGDPLIICLGKFPEPLLNLNLKTPVC